MGIYIKGMKMPKCCNDCWALDDDGDYPRCRITEEQSGYTFKSREQKMSKCPLTEVSEPHGRLVDADMAYQETMVYGEHFRKSVLKVIGNLPTVIESEVEE